MSYAAYETTEIEDSTNERGDGTQSPKLLVMPGGQDQPGEWVAHRVAEVLDFELARGSMPT
jgi:hypothetical protein